MGFSVDGLDEFITRISDLENHTDGLFRRCAYEGAKVIADEIKKGLNNLRVVEARWGTSKHPLQGVTEKQKADLIKSMGVSRIQTANGVTTVSVGFHGYGSEPTKQYPKGIPNRLLIQEVESGTSFMRKQPVVRSAINRAKKSLDSAIQNEATKYINERMK